ncbi:MAG: DNA-directed RNA polymerase subunit omega [Clostridia bacterium]|nr:DNA-directed RNA polymerase subunit omega [Clostridia bacterium]
MNKKTIDDIFEQTDSRYALVEAVAKKARDIADKAEQEGEILYKKPVNIVLDNLLSGKSVVAKPTAAAKVYESDNFEITVSVPEED